MVHRHAGRSNSACFFSGFKQNAIIYQAAMTTKFIIKYITVLLLILTAGSVILYMLLPNPVKRTVIEEDPLDWYAPSVYSLINHPDGDIILYGRELILHTSKYLGPKGTVAKISNGMNCGNCHLQGGTLYNGFSFSAVSANYPKYRARNDTVETIEYRINECFARSLNGKRLDTLSREMLAMVAYMKWLGNGVPKDKSPHGSGVPPISYMNRAADPGKGQKIFAAKCVTCHGTGGQGQLYADATEYNYPPVWGVNSYNVSAGLYRLSSLASFIRYNMPYDTTGTVERVSDEEAWDLAAFVNSQQRPEVFFKQDWPKIEKKPFDHPFGPYADTFSQARHKYGPFPKNKKQGK
jgi:thiosulfate dehydrogenase